MFSFPFFHIAKQRHIPYERVLKVHAELVNDPFRLEMLGSDQTNSNTPIIALAKAELAEQERRRIVADMATTVA